jgi:hypothetical protein
MKGILLSVSVLALFSFGATAYASTCVAPGHASCTIACKAACGAVFKDPDGPCNTYCDEGIKKTRSARMSVMTQDLSHGATVKLIQFKTASAVHKAAPPAKTAPPAGAKPK